MSEEQQQEQQGQEAGSPDRSGLRVPAANFAAFCELEFERRRNSGEPFAEAEYREAMAMTLRRLRAQEGEEEV